MFSHTMEYALRAMALLAYAQDAEQLTSTIELAEKAKVPNNYLAKVLQQLSSSKLITGRRGVGGGYRLARPAAEIKLLEIVRSVGTLERITTCPLGLANHGSTLCPLHRTVDLAAKAAMDILDDATLADLISGGVKPLCDEAMTLTVSARGSR
ncbi:MAG: Rrf2 family transcriptional regulator [Phycisphaeraceae bacterium]|nr:Rrf2 family transcriptional regulator [Phycisphaeraceae bacterium]MCW5753950.1 Rrf2 family transcriptional regulator [Phycisphaeraceae bacterium]